MPARLTTMDGLYANATSGVLRGLSGHCTVQAPPGGRRAVPMVQPKSPWSLVANATKALPAWSIATEWSRVFPGLHPPPQFMLVRMGPVQTNVVAGGLTCAANSSEPDSL